MKIKIKQFDKSLPLPAYKSQGAACMDLYARKDSIITPRSVGYIPLNVAIEVPKGYWVLVAARGSTHKSGIMPAHGFGIGDWDFKGDNDEYVFPVYNFTDKIVKIEKGTRIAQMMILKCQRIEPVIVERLESPDRGKFGSTGSK